MVQVLAVAILLQRRSQLAKLLGVDEPSTPSNLFWARDLQALSMLQRGDELPGLEQALVRAGVQPRIATLHDLHVERAGVQVGLVDSGDLQLTARAWLDGLGD